MFGFGKIFPVPASIGPALLLAGLAGAADAHRAGGQRPGPESRASSSEDSYRRVLRAHFQLSAGELRVLEAWGLPIEEIPVVLFLRRRTALNPDAIIALRRRGTNWCGVAEQVGLSREAFDLPLSPGSLYGMSSRGAAVRGRRAASCSDRAVVTLVNVRMLAASEGVPARAVVRARDRTGSFPEALVALRDPGR